VRCGYWFVKNDSLVLDVIVSEAKNPCIAKIVEAAATSDLDVENDPITDGNECASSCHAAAACFFKRLW
jgi:hypothetical protein